MAQNDALTFYVKFEEDSSKNIKTLVDNLAKQLKNMVVNLDSKNIDVSGIKTAISKLEGVKVVDQKNLTETENHIKKISELLEKAFNGKGNGEQFTGILRALVQIREEIGKVSTAMDSMSSAISSLGSGMSANLGKAIVNNMSQINEAIDKTIIKIHELHKATEDPGKTGTPKAINDAVNVDMAKTKISEINSQLTNIWKQLNASFKLGFDTGKLDEYSMKLQRLRAQLQEVISTGGGGKRVDEILRSANYGSLKRDSSNEVKAVNEVSIAVEKLKAALDSLANIKGVGELRKKLTDLKSQLEYIGKDPGGIKMQQSEHVNRYLNDLLKQTNDAVKSNEKAQKEQQKEQKAQQADIQKLAEAQQKVKGAIDETTQAARKLKEVYNEMSRLKTMFPDAKINFSSILSQMSAVARAQNNMRRELQMGANDPQRLLAFADSSKISSWKNGMTSALREVDVAIKKITGSANLGHVLDNIGEKLKAIKNIGARADSFGFKALSGDAKRAYEDLKKIEEELKKIQQTGKSSKGLGFADFMKTGDVQAALNRAGLSEKAITNGLDKALQKRRDRNDQEINRLKETLRELQQMRNVNPQVKVVGVENAIQEVQKLIEQLNKSKEAGLSRQSVDLGRFGVNETAATMAQIRGDHTASLQSAAIAANQNTEAQRRMEQAIANATGKAQQQSQVLSDLRSMAAQYLSVWGATSFIKEIAQITGELELQQRSLEVIIGSAGQAQEMFNNIKGLSQMSPYTFQDMLKSTRQLAAFGVETKNLYDTMKSLSDLGAGLSVDVQRLILAYGHVKSAGVLSGIQRRQFETAGINITGEIAKVYNQRYERAGSDERVTNADIFKKITKREIGFEDVEQAIKNLTSEGGKFYNMQLRQYETLGGKLRNLRNNYNIMLDDIGKKYMELLTGGVDALNSMMENWRTWGALIKSVTVALVAAKVASLALGKSWKSMSAARNAARQMRYEAQAMAFTNRTGEIAPLGATAQAATRFNWKFWQGQQRTMLPPSYAPSVINAEGLNKFQKLRMALHKDVASFDRAWIAQQLDYGQQYQKHIAGLNGWRLGMERMKVSAQSFFTTMRAGFLSIATNPMVWIGAAIAGITALVNKSNELKTAMEHTTENEKRIAREDIENINSSLNPIKSGLYDNNGNFNKAALDTNGFEATFQELDEIMQKHDPLYKGHMFDIKQMGDEAEIIKGMISDIESVRRGNEIYEKRVVAIQSANSDTGYDGTWDNPFSKKWSTLTEKMHQTDQDFSNLKARIILDADEIESALKTTLPNVYNEWKNSGMEFEDFMASFALRINESQFKSLTSNNLALDDFRKPLKDLMGDYDGVKNKVKDVAAVIAKGFDPKDIEGSMQYFEKAVNGLFNTEGSEVKNAELQESFVNLILANLPDDSVSPQIRERMYEVIMKANLSEAIKQALDDGSVDPNNVDDNAVTDIESRFNAIAEKIINSTADKNLRTAIKNISKNIFKDFRSDPTPAFKDFDRSWQKLYTSITDPNDPRRKLIAKFETQFKNSVSDYEFWAAIDKEVKSIKERLAQMRNVYTVLQTIKIRPEMLFDSRTIQKQIDDIVREMTGKLKSKDYVGLKEMNEYVQGLAAMRDIFKASELSNRSLGTEDREKYESKQAKAAEKRQKEQERAAEKAKRAAEKRKQEQEKAAQEAERKEIERIRNRIQQLQDLRREYKDLRQDNSKEAAMRQTQERYRHDYGENGVLSDAELNAIEDYSKILDEEIKAIKSNKKILNEEHRKSLIEAARRAQSELNNIIFKEKSDQMLSTLNSDLQKLLQQYESAKKVIDATGDAEAASQISGIGITQLKGGWLDNILESVLNTRFAVLLQSYDLDPSKYNIDYKRIAELDEKGIEEYVKDLIGDEQTSALVKAISTWLKEFKRQHDNVGKLAVDAYAKAIGSAMDYESQIMRINSELKEQNDLIDRSNASPDYKRRAKEINESRAEVRRLELSGSYKRFFDGIFDEPMSQMEAMRTVLEGAYARALRSGAISAEDYAKKIEEIDKVMREAAINNPEAWWNKGFFDNRTQEQRQNEMRNRGYSLYWQGSDLYQQAIQNGDQKGAKDALEMMQKGKSMVEGANKAAIAMAIIDKVVHNIDKAIQGTLKAFGYLTEALAALGEENDTMAAIGDYLNTLGEMSGHVASSWDSFKSGDYVGAGVEAFGAITSLITGFSQAHDNRLQRKIDHIKEDTAKMSNTLESIRSLRERQLGYDNGNMRTRMASMYGITDYGDFITNRFMNGNSAAAAMFDYYTRYRGGSGYEQELKLLEEQRQKLIEMYNLEDRKKKKNKEELEEYQTQIADLDEQIMFFTEDLANQLWGIDLKGWADQLGDALMTAFENGSSAAAAFKDTVQDIMRGVVKNMLTVGIIEPALENLRVKLFGNNGNGGLFDPNNPKGSMGAVLNGLSNWFETEGPQLMDAANEFYNGADNMMRQILGYGMRENEKSTNTVNSISSAASEETMGIVAGYLSRLSQDVSVQRIMQEMFVNGSWPSYIEQVTSVNNSISSIDRSTTAMMEMMRDGTGALYERVENMSRRLDNFANGIDRIAVM